jgi:hypothetical protein
MTLGFHQNSSALLGVAAGFVQGACMPESDPFACAKAKTLRDTVAIGG